MKTKIFILLLSAYMNAFILEGISTAMSDSNLYIYGTITTVDDEEYTGQIRWGKEEAFWFDHFNSSKPENENLQYLSRRELNKLESNDRSDKWNLMRGWNAWSDWSSRNGNTHVFACQFGDIKSLRPQRGERLILELRNGEQLRLRGGSNDVGATVLINDIEIGKVKLDWDRIEQVDFFAAPQDMVSAFGEPLFGTVETVAGNFSGYLQWDHDERLSDDELNGDTKNGKLDIPFGNIKSITQSYRGSRVELKSGRIMELTGSNDVDDDNRGIIVNMIDMGRVDIPWDEFVKINFEAAPQNSMVLYDGYAINRKIRGSVESVSGDQLSGRMIYDLDENYDIEILNGIKDEIEYFIPFRNIASIRPRSRAKSLVTLTNGEAMLLSGKVDINEDNDGVLVFTSEDDYEYVPWDEIEEITITDR